MEKKKLKKSTADDHVHNNCTFHGEPILTLLISYFITLLEKQLKKVKKKRGKKRKYRNCPSNEIREAPGCRMLKRFALHLPNKCGANRNTIGV